MSNSNVTGILQDVKARLLAIEALKLEGKTAHIYSYEELTDKSKAVSFPAVGVIYEGMRPDESANGNGKASSSISSRVIISVLLLTDNDNKAGGIPILKAHEYLDLLRDAINNKEAPNGKKYRFEVEAPASEKANKVLWVQRWSVSTVI